MATQTPEMATRTREPRGTSEPGSVRLDHLDDDRLALAVARHGAPAFELLYERMAPRVYGFCCSMLRDPGEAEDVLQETMTRAYHALSRPRETMQVKSWLFAIARNACIDRVRQSGPQLAESPFEELLDQVPAAQTSLEDRERLRVLIADLGSLSEAQRTALALREMSGLAHEEIAISLETTPARVKSLISEARRGLAERAVGREMPCEELRRTVTEGGGRALRGRAVRAHVEGCEACGAFVEETRESRSLALLMPALPAAHSKSILAGVLGGGVGMSGSGIGGLLSALGAKQLLALLAVAGAIGGGVVVATGAPGSLFGGGSDGDPAAAGGAAGGEAGAGDGSVADPRLTAGAPEPASAERGPDGSPVGSGPEQAASTPSGTTGGGSGGGGATRLMEGTGTLGGQLLEPIGGGRSLPGLGDLTGSLETRVEAPTSLTPTVPNLPAAPDASLPTGLEDPTSVLPESAGDPTEQLGRSTPDAPSVP